MVLIIALDIAVILWMSATAFSKGFENVLPLAAFLLLLFPNETRIQLPGLFDLTTQRVIILVLCALYLMVGRQNPGNELKEPLPLRYPLAALILWMLLSSARSVVPAVSFKSTLSQYFDFCTAYFIYVRCVRSPELLRKVLGGFVAGMTVCSIFGIIEVYLDWSVTSLFPVVAGRFADLESVDSRGTRVQSTFDHAILFGAALALAIPMTLYLLSMAEKQKDKTRLWASLALMMLCIYKTNSRGPWMALVLSIGIVMLVGTGKLRKLLIVLAACSLLVLVARPGMRSSITSLYGATLDPDSPQGESYQWRYVLYDIAKRELSKDLGRSLWGFGPESFYYLGLTTEFKIEGEIHTVKVESCDSAVVELMMDTGYVGLSLVALLLGTAVTSGLRRYFAPGGSKDVVQLILISNILSFCFLMTNVELFGWGQQSYMLWIVLALVMSKAAESGVEQQPAPAIDANTVWSARVPHADARPLQFRNERKEAGARASELWR